MTHDDFVQTHIAMAATLTLTPASPGDGAAATVTTSRLQSVIP
jgi:hypothetical protein